MKSFWLCFVYAVLAALVICSSALFKANASSVDGSVSICFALREGASLASIEKALVKQGYSERDAGWITGLNVRVHCPDLTQRVLREARGTA